MTNHVELDINGAKIALYPMNEVRAVLIRAIIRAGSYYEENEKWGRFHLLEHLTCQGTKNLFSRVEIETYKEQHVISSNAWTGCFDMGYWFEFPDLAYKQGFYLFNEMVFKSSIPQSQISRENRVIQQEYTDKWSSPYRRYGRALDHLLFGKNHPYCRDGMGDPEYISQFGRADLEKICKTYYVPENMVITIVGKIDIPAITDELHKLLDPINNRKLKTPVWNEQNISQDQFLLHLEDVDQVGLDLSWMMPGRDDIDIRDRLKFFIASYIIGGSARSMIYTKLREELGLVYSASSRAWFMPKAGAFTISTSTNAKNAKEVIGYMYNIVHEFIDKKITPHEFERSKHYLNMKTLISYDSIDSIASQLSGSLFWENRVITPDEYIEIIETITLKEVKEIFNKYTSKEQNLKLGILSKNEIEVPGEVKKVVIH